MLFDTDLVLAASVGIALGAVTGALMMVALLIVKRKYVLVPFIGPTREISKIDSLCDFNSTPSLASRLISTYFIKETLFMYYVFGY